MTASTKVSAVIRYILGAQSISPPERLVLLAFSTVIEEGTAEAWLPTHELRTRTGFTERQLKDHLHSLESKGHSVLFAPDGRACGWRMSTYAPDAEAASEQWWAQTKPRPAASKFSPSTSLLSTRQIFIGEDEDHGIYNWDVIDGTALYRMFAAPNAQITQVGTNLLYVGISDTPLRRINQHAATKIWFPYVHTIVLQEYADRPAALTAEACAIYAERPLENLRGRDTTPRGSTPRPTSVQVLTRAAPNQWASAADWDEWIPAR